MSRSFSLLLASSLLLAVLALQPAGAGTQQDPEVTDAEHDISLLGVADGCTPPNPPIPVICTGDVGDAVFGAGLGGDIIHAWIDHENATTFTVNIETHSSPSGFMDGSEPQQAGTAIGSIRLTATLSANGTSKSAIALYSKADGTATVGGVALSVAHNDTITSLVVPRSAFGNPAAGTLLANLTVLGESLGLGPTAPADQGALPKPIFTDRAPDTGVGRAYNLTVGPGSGGGNGTTDGNLDGAPGCTYKSGETNRTDGDADCLPDWWETKYFGGTSGQNGTGDPDGDGCDNRCEYLHGTDPTKKDTDGDGVGDNDEIKAGTDPLDPSSHTGGSTTTTTTTHRTSSSTTTHGATSAQSTSASALDKIQADAGYAVASGAAMGAIVLISLIGLFGRWGA